ncbi:hypothetical protein [Xylocopilactobacillus apicola]|uniref:Cation:proton antiporter n=1 Tax=Xylocopilactobacillus apicola TaxID=2932184 RepID=A0AAU9DMR4_9LACO|nr:hypothetical protein [Xylocopilactobacillus apicola]BDR58287.1 hypothetical protein XA3_07280 [Xylocopilactobacillus apicola]
MQILFGIYAILIALCGAFITVKKNFLKLTNKQILCYDLYIGVVVIITIGAIITKNTWFEFFSLILGVTITFIINRVLIKSMKGK